ncbi:MAG: class I SAM-dependent methyltransferase [Thalassobaculaceae bacterium]
MSLEQTVSEHYSNKGLLNKIYKGLEKLGIDKNQLTQSDLSSFDEFHIGGSESTLMLAEKLVMNASSSVLDIGCGIGGPARFLSSEFGCKVSGIDLTADFVNTGNSLTDQVGLSDKVKLIEASALSIPFADNSFDVSYMIHVGMNIADKDVLFSEAFRVTKPGGVFGIYDVMLLGNCELQYPLPWAVEEDGNAIASATDYISALIKAGFSLKHEDDKTDFANSFFEKMSARTDSSDGPPPVGLHLLMGDLTTQKIRNMAKLIKSGIIAPKILILEK